MKEIPKIAGKKYALHNSYFKHRKENYPDTLPEIVRYRHRYGELPFEYGGEDWLYEAAIERQKRCGVQHSQYLTPGETAAQVAALADSFLPGDNRVLDACCGTGQLTRYLRDSKLHVTGFDSDPDMVEVCRLACPQGEFYRYDFHEPYRGERFSLILSNPPYEQKEIIPFLEWLTCALNVGGKAILILPKGFVDKERPKALGECLSRFEVLYREDMRRGFVHTGITCEVCVVGLAQGGKQACRDNPKEEELAEGEKIVLVPLDRISPNPENSRKRFGAEELEELARSIRRHGLLHPVTLREKAGGYQIVYGERRCRAFHINGGKAIPAIIRPYSDEQAPEVTLVENISRHDLSPMEESDAYRRLADTRGYGIEELCLASGKGEGYIRRCLSLQRLTGEFRQLLDEEAISPGIAFETAKYAPELQKRIYREHFTGDDESSWRHLGVKQYAGQISRLYSNDLSRFGFDKGECEKCSFNTALYELFPGKEGRCTHSECLEEKKDRFTEEFCRAVLERYPGMEVCIAPCDRIGEGLEKSLEQAGIGVKTLPVKAFPEKPAAPIHTDFETTEEYEAACAEFDIEEAAYSKEMEEIEEKVRAGVCKKVAYIGDNHPRVGYVSLPGKPALSPAQALKKQDEDNKRAAAGAAARDAAALLGSEGFACGTLSLFEDELLAYAMLDSLDVKYFPLFGLEGRQGQVLTGQDKYRLMKSLSAEQKALVCRCFLLRHLSGTHKPGAYGSMLLVEFARRHHPEQTEDIVRRHSESYNKKSLRLREQIRALEAQAAEKQPQTEGGV